MAALLLSGCETHPVAYDATCMTRNVRIYMYPFVCGPMNFFLVPSIACRPICLEFDTLSLNCEQVQTMQNILAGIRCAYDLHRCLLM